MKRLGLILLAATPLFGQSALPAPVRQAMDLFSEAAMRAHVRFLSSDLLEGRGPGSRGDAITTQYLASQFETYGVKPAGDNGTFFQKVPLVGITLDGGKSSLSFTRAGAPAMGPLKHLEQYVGGDQTQRESSTLDSEVVFVGHGVTAPEYRWDDYKGLDVRGKTLIMLVNDPPATASEPDLFKGRARTYYGRWTYKFETGTVKGAQAVFLIHTEGAAGYGWQVVRNSWGGEQSYTRVGPDDPALRMAGWITEAFARDLFRAAGHDLDALTRSAGSRDFKPVPLGYRLTGSLTSTVRPFETQNVVARIDGTDARLREEAVVYTAHHDHMGIATPDERGDTIYNGAIDNATGTALLLDLARVWSRSAAPKRSIIFAAVAAEEQGLLGSKWYGLNPTVPAGRIALNLNFDSIYQFGRVRDVTMIGAERTTFFPTAQRVAAAMGLTIVPDQNPEQGYYYRSDHFSLGKVGIPAFSVDQGQTVVGKPVSFGADYEKEYRDKRYHQPADEFDPAWDFSSSVQMGELGFWLGWEAANAAEMPNWVVGDEFRAIRDKSRR
ncbi:MAG TPA: M28 family peptidase [Thermoanaerobaculia bacterium]|nr:M28 family peptidase [Thermoanaerobaculia bacterium]